MTPDWLIFLFLFALGACVGSFLNVVVYRMPRNLSLVSPPSTCPKCQTRLAWHDNVPILGWLWLGGKCRTCKQSISSRYPIVEALTAVMFVAFAWAVLRGGFGPCTQMLGPNALGVDVLMTMPMSLDRDAILLGAYLFLLAALLAASLIDAEFFIIPLEICWITAGVGILAHALGDRVASPGSLVAGPRVAAMAVGAGVGVTIAIIAVRLNWLQRSFADVAPMLEHEKDAAIASGEEVVTMTRGQISGEMVRELAFLTPAVVLAAVAITLTSTSSLSAWWTQTLANAPWLAAGLGSLAAGLVGGLVVWMTRIFGSLGFGREAMGLGDVHLMFGVGCVIGGLHATVAFFIAPFFGLGWAAYVFLSRRRRELPYGPYLAVASVLVLLFHCSITHYPGFDGLALFIGRVFGSNVDNYGS